MCLSNGCYRLESCLPILSDNKQFSSSLYSENSDTEDKLVECVVLVVPIQLHRVPLLHLHGLGSKEEVIFSESIRANLSGQNRRAS